MSEEGEKKDIAEYWTNILCMLSFGLLRDGEGSRELQPLLRPRVVLKKNKHPRSDRNAYAVIDEARGSRHIPLSRVFIFSP